MRSTRGLRRAPAEAEVGPGKRPQGRCPAPLSQTDNAPRRETPSRAITRSPLIRPAFGSYTKEWPTAWNGFPPYLIGARGSELAFGGCWVRHDELQHLKLAYDEASRELGVLTRRVALSNRRAREMDAARRDNRIARAVLGTLKQLRLGRLEKLAAIRARIAEIGGY